MSATPPGLDEMVDGAGGLRPHWREVLGTFAALGEELPARARRLARAAEEEGIASILPSISTAGPAWRCDPVPLPIPASEFAALSAGLDQRARLLEAVLADLYGPQHLLANGHLPPALVFANPGFLRPCCGLPLPGVRLHFYAADLVRGPDGGWTVLNDRTAGAAGLGAALENRLLLARVLPEAFRPLQVRQLRPFMELWQDSLQRLAPPARGNPSVALLTPGVGDPHWFEHMLLSRELSCALVEPGDLTVRGGAVFLKTLKGLEPVDVLLRRLDAHLLDPLELEGSVAAGVPGLLDAARAGAVRIVNDPGSGAAEAPALATFLPALSRRLLGEDLMLPTVPTLWLGDEGARARVLGEPGRWRLLPGLDSAQAVPDALSLAELSARVAERPWAWVARALLPPSVAPSFDGFGLSPRPVVLRLFLVHDGTGWQTMPGGLARVLAADELPVGLLPTGGLAKDVWVLADDRGDLVGPAPQAMPPLKLRRTAGELPSRVADNLFWLGRTVERLERAARLVRAAIARLDRGGGMLPREVAELACLLQCLVQAAVISRDVAATASPAGLAQALLAAVRETRERGTISRLFAEAARLTESARDRLTGDMYTTFTTTLRSAREETAAAGRSLDALGHALAAVQRYSAAVAGMAAENMVRGGGWLFLELGRRIERAQAVVAEAGCALDTSPPRIEIGLRLLLELCDSSITYRSRYLTVIQAAPVLDLVLADVGNPRGLAFQLAAMHTLLDELHGEGTNGTAAKAGERLAATPAGLLAEAEALVEDVLAAPDQAVAAARLQRRLRDLGAGLAGLSDRVTRRYFALLPAAQSLGWGNETLPVEVDPAI
jgi:uncharacterized circularly permuted ATP-grasp superfamily protein/uncharacterized alpha-E superfamily protein